MRRNAKGDIELCWYLHFDADGEPLAFLPSARRRVDGISVAKCEPMSALLVGRDHRIVFYNTKYVPPRV